MQKIIRIQSIQQQDASRRQELAIHTPSQRMNMLFALIDPAPENAVRVLKSLEEFGFGSAGIELRHLTAPSTAVTLGMQPNQIDLLCTHK